VYSQDADKQYAQTFGTGVIVFSDREMPPRAKFDKSMFDFRNGIFYIKVGADSSISLRALLKGGKTFGYYLDQKKKEYDAKSIVEGSERVEFAVYVSHGDAGTSNGVWPKNLKEEPSDIFYRGYISYNMSELLTSNNLGLKWTDITNSDFDGVPLTGWLAKAKPGYRVFMSFKVSIVINTTWDPIEQKWNTMLCRTDPLAIGTLEIK
jgi:hypothetical protein